MRAKYLLPFFGALLASGMADAATMAGSYAITTGGTAPVSETNLLASPFSMALTVGTPVTVDFIKLTSHEQFGFHSDSLTVDANFSFTQPSSQTFTDHGTGNVDIFAIFTSGTLSWADGASGTNVSFGDGSIINVNLSDVSFDGFLEDSETVKATFTMVQGAKVPEPATLAIFGTALLGFCAVRRRRV